MKQATDDFEDADRTTARGLGRYAHDFIKAARQVDETMGSSPGYERVSPVPAYFLVHHGIELALKAYLRHKGLTLRELSSRTYGHDLRACYRKAKELGLQNHFEFTQSDEHAFNLLTELNKNHELRYIKTGAKTFPSWGIVEPLAVRLQKAVAGVVGCPTFREEFVPVATSSGGRSLGA